METLAHSSDSGAIEFPSKLFTSFQEKLCVGIKWQQQTQKDIFCLPLVKCMSLFYDSKSLFLFGSCNIKISKIVKWYSKL